MGSVKMYLGGRHITVLSKLPKLVTRVRLPSSAKVYINLRLKGDSRRPLKVKITQNVIRIAAPEIKTIPWCF